MDYLIFEKPYFSVLLLHFSLHLNGVRAQTRTHRERRRHVQKGEARRCGQFELYSYMNHTVQNSAKNDSEDD